MTLPRFTSGQFGRLDFSHLNDAFGYIDLQRGSAQKDRRAEDDPLPLITARIGSSLENSPNGWFHAWKEVVYGNGGWTEVQNGRKAGIFNPHQARALDGSRISDGTIVVLAPKRYRETVYGSAGALEYYLIVATEPSMMVPVRIDESALMTGRTDAWVYTVTRVNFSVSNFVPAYQAVGTQGALYNSVEHVSDSGDVFGVGSFRNSNVIVQRRPLRNGLIVTAIRYSDELYLTSTPNGYRYTCT